MGLSRQLDGRLELSTPTERRPVRDTYFDECYLPSFCRRENSLGINELLRLPKHELEDSESQPVGPSGHARRVDGR